MCPAGFVLALASALLSAPAAHAASAQACDGYATAAIAQYRTATGLGLPTPFPIGSDDYQHHYVRLRFRMRSGLPTTSSITCRSWV
jgi:hypothetical protein